ncbi:FidL [Pectobacterium zantedeschiae]|uniref:FidL n=1 Tax=Pectobacterium zantedeschiae TaxID=2034769 RepID=A0A9X8P6J3_9GAMM|nr:FidL [Pectobacterium zantedeschiae]RYC42326.1 FidL [Pectobacterium zantedeschiae]RYC43461.1 FidL [Pectobacterium zantedeschiae]RYC45564.1 FidL [Pectobacterium zantedeschiae]RYC47402.1 FidL [Pectobacterium zantedeschiae]
MLIIRIRKTFFCTTLVLFVSFSLGVIFYLKSDLYRKPLICQGEVKLYEEDHKVRKEYDVYFYLNKQNRALVLVNGLYIGEDGVPLTIRRTFSFDSVWESNRLVVNNIGMSKNTNDNAPDEAIPILAENDVIQFEMLTKHAYLISTVQSKMACNIRD